MQDDRKDRERLLAGFRLLESPGHLIRRAHQRSYDIFADQVGDDLTRQQTALLIALSQNPGAAQSTIVAATGFDRATIAEMLGRLVKRGWVARERDPQDGRAWTLHITQAGHELLLDRIPGIVAAQAEIVKPLPAELQPVFVQCLRILLGMEPQPE